MIAAAKGEQIRVFIVDDHALVREWLTNLLRREPDLVVIGEAEEPAAAFAAMRLTRPDVAVVDVSLKQGSGLELIKQLRDELPSVEVVVLSMHDRLRDVERAFRAGATGYVMKRESTGQIVEAIRQARSGKLFANSEMLQRLAARSMGRVEEPESSPTDLLSDREVEVFRRLGEGYSNKEIADQLGVNLKTVQTYCARMKEKLGAKDAQGLVRVAYRWHQRQAGA